MGVFEILAVSVAFLAFSLFLFSDDKVKKLEKRVRELENKINEK
ncbi:hypothetical protein [Alteribacter lacisalsi]|nr:hypothetical protein [Alteribacter lacisalsi]